MFSLEYLCTNLTLRANRDYRKVPNGFQFFPKSKLQNTFIACWLLLACINKFFKSMLVSIREKDLTSRNWILIAKSNFRSQQQTSIFSALSDFQLFLEQ